jgi:hypothetical protein
MTDPVPDIHIVPQEFKCTVRLKYVFFPIDLRDIRDILAKNGYELTSIRGPIPGRPLRVMFGGDVARKGEVTIDIDTSESLVGVYGKSNKKVLEAFEQLLNIVKQEVDIDLHSNVWFYEIAAHYQVKTGSSPILNLSKITADNPYFSKFSDILKQETSSFSLRLSPKNQLPNSENWFDVSIEQDILLADVYHVGVVFRNSRKQIVENFGLALDDTVIKLIKVVEVRE